MAINSSIQNLININRLLSSPTDINNLFYYFYGRQATPYELKYWATKTSGDLTSKLIPNAAQFKNAGYYKDVISPPVNSSAQPSTKNDSTSAPVSNNNNSSSSSVSSNNGSGTGQVLPDLSRDQITKAFKAYGYTPSEADLQYWELKPSSDLTTLHDKLVARQEKEQQTKAEQEKATADANKKSIDNTADAEINFADNTKGSLVKFAEDPDGSGPFSTATVFFVNPNTKQLVPINSADAFNKFFTGTDLATATANGSIKTLHTNALNTSLADYEKVPLSQGINGTDSDNKYKINTSTDTSKLGTHYGQSELSSDQITQAFSALNDGLFEAVKNDPNSGITSQLIDQIKSDPTAMAFYLNAVAYGGYTIPDIVRDLKRKQLVANGQTNLQNTTIIDPTQTADAYKKTTQGTTAYSNNDLTPPSYIGDLDMGILNYSVFKLPQSAFDTLVKPFDPNSEEGQAEMNSVKDALHDVVLQQVQAQTERDKAVADASYKDLADQVSKKYGITLSNNAETAWGQINSLGQNTTDSGISGSGIEAETMDKYLAGVRKNDELQRQNKLTEDEQNKKKYLTESGSAADIAALTPEEKAKYGFAPTADVTSYFSDTNLKSLFPDLSQDQINAYKNSILDENGNYRSTLYQTLYKNKYGTMAGLSIPANGIIPAKKEVQQAKVIEQKSNAEEKAAAQYTSNDPFSKDPVVDNSKITPANPPAGVDSSNSDYWASNPNNKIATGVPASNPPANTQMVANSSTPNTFKIKNKQTGSTFDASAADWNSGVYNSKNWQLA